MRHQGDLNWVCGDDGLLNIGALEVKRDLVAS
jgi:uncharacterized protein (DUF2252 family)